MGALTEIIDSGNPSATFRPWPCVGVDADTWRLAADGLALGELSLVSLWGDAGMVHMALLDGADNRIAMVGLACHDGKYPSVGARHAPAIRLERAAADLFGLVADGADDTRPWLDHGRWSLHYPLADKPPEQKRPVGAYEFLAAEGEGLHRIPVGPVHAGIIEPGHFRFTAAGETIVRLEERLGYVHKGVDRLMAGADLDRAVRLAGRISGDATVAYSLAFSRAVEAALSVEVPRRAVFLRALMAELERLANHFGDIGAICNDAAFALMQAHAAMLRERVLRFSALAFRHRLMMDCIVPGGVRVDLDASGIGALGELTTTIRGTFPRLVSLYDNTASLQDRTVATGTLAPELARRFAAGGYVGRASARAFDTRRALAYPPYDALDFEVPVRADGDVNARVWIRIAEVDESLRLIDQILAKLPEGQISVPLAVAGGEGAAMVESFRGDVFASVRISADGKLARCHLRDPSWFQWPLLEAAIEGNIVADFPLCNKSFNCSYSGHDL